MKAYSEDISGKQSRLAIEAYLRVMRARAAPQPDASAACFSSRVSFTVQFKLPGADFAIIRRNGR